MTTESRFVRHLDRLNRILAALNEDDRNIDLVNTILDFVRYTDLTDIQIVNRILNERKN